MFFTTLRVMIESEDVIKKYFGPNGYGYDCIIIATMQCLLFHCHRWLSVIIYTVFLFLVITVLLNLLIAQMSDTYTNVQSDAQRSLFINRAWIVARAEHNSLFASAFFVRHLASAYSYVYALLCIHGYCANVHHCVGLQKEKIHQL